MPTIAHLTIDGTTYDFPTATSSLPEVTYISDMGYSVNTAVRIQAGNTFLAEGPASISGMIATSADNGIVISNAPAFTCDCMISASAFNATSDIRLKENIKDTELDYNYLLDNLHIVDFNFLNDENKNTNVGLIAQELREVLPEKYREAIVVKNPTTGYWCINESKLTYIALLALKEQKQQITELEARITALENK